MNPARGYQLANVDEILSKPRACAFCGEGSTVFLRRIVEGVLLPPRCIDCDKGLLQEMRRRGSVPPSPSPASSPDVGDA